jgi:radical SAM protein with 4Fe4S-binding SPASM domain
MYVPSRYTITTPLHAGRVLAYNSLSGALALWDHKCWDTVSEPSRAIGTLFDLDALNHSELSGAWLRWTRFDNETCRNCKILPNCAGACAYKFVHSGSQRGEAAILAVPELEVQHSRAAALARRRIGRAHTRRLRRRSDTH